MDWRYVLSDLLMSKARKAMKLSSIILKYLLENRHEDIYKVDDQTMQYWLSSIKVLESIIEVSEGGEKSDGIISPTIERSLSEGLKAKIERLNSAIEKLHPYIQIDMPDEVEMYCALHDLKDAATSL